MKTKYLLIAAAFILSVILLVGCSSNSSQPATSSVPTTQTSSTLAPANQAAVTISGFAFSPPTLTVSKGTTVTWTNNDSTTHTVTSDSSVWDSGNVIVGKTYSFTFNQTGTFPYHCNIHPSMTAKVIVQ
ncbi:MAG TPA: cupredoxin family copper-binding protein [Dehalococcoidales bacterium]